MECSEISSPIIGTHKTPLQTHNFFPAGFHKKIDKFYGDVTLVYATPDPLVCFYSLRDLKQNYSLKIRNNSITLKSDNHFTKCYILI